MNRCLELSHPAGSSPSTDGELILDGFTTRLIRRKARQVVRRAGFSRSDRDDIEQELRLKLVKDLASYDPDQGHRHAFVVTVVERCVANLLRNRAAEKRGCRCTCSLDVVIEDGEEGPTELGETIGDRQYNARRVRWPRDAHELIELTADIEKVLADLPPELRELAEALKSESISAIARRTSTPRTTLYQRVRQLRRRFVEANSRDFF